jgi:hypothetical protein
LVACYQRSSGRLRSHKERHCRLTEHYHRQILLYCSLSSVHDRAIEWLCHTHNYVFLWWEGAAQKGERDN